MEKPFVYVPVFEPSIFLEGCEVLLKNLLQRLIEKQINGTSEYTSDYRNIIRVKITRIELIFE